MAGGLLQLAGYGNQDIYLTGSPLISYFKVVYRRYTNFSMENISLDMDKTELSFNQQKQFTRIFDRNADLVSKVYLSLSLPEIMSPPGYEFQWIKNIGTNMISSVSVFIQGRKIDEHYGEWLHIWHELHLTADFREGYNEMIGNIPEIYDPANAPGNNGIYPSSVPGVDFLPSIKETRLYVPLIFWFNRHPGLALPLIALQYHEVELQFTLRPVKDLYTIIETKTSSANYGYRIKPLENDSSHSIANFLADGTLSTINNDGTRNLVRLILIQVLK
jgi:hypothetical protein